MWWIVSGKDAVSLRIAEQYLSAFSNIAKQSTTLLLPGNVNDPASIVTQALAVYGAINKNTPISPTPNDSPPNLNDPSPSTGIKSKESGIAKPKFSQEEIERTEKQLSQMIKAFSG